MKAHHVVGELVALSENRKVSLPDLSDADALEICPELKEDWREVFNLDRAFSKREKPGMPGPERLHQGFNFKGILQAEPEPVQVRAGVFHFGCTRSSEYGPYLEEYKWH